jgi:hypothetical protein
MLAQSLEDMGYKKSKIADLQHVLCGEYEKM